MECNFLSTPFQSTFNLEKIELASKLLYGELVATIFQFETRYIPLNIDN